MISEIVKSFMKELNAKKCYDLIKIELNESITKGTVEKVYTAIRTVFKKYYSIVYQREVFGETNAHKYFSVDESLFCTDENKNHIWVLGIIDNTTKDFRLDIAYERNQNILKSFIMNYINRGNIIVCDGWQGYAFLDNIEGYTRDMHIHGGGDFGLGLTSTSHIESIWSQLKSILKNIYYIIPHQNFILYLREAEWRVKNKNKTLDEKIASFFAAWELVYNMEPENFENDLYLIDE